MAGHEELVWRKSTRSSSNGCVEIAVRAESGAVLIRDSQDPAGPSLEFDKQQFGAFISCVKGDRDWV